jgi:hypothetical protein
MRRLQRGFREEDAVIRDEADEEAVEPGEPRHERRRVALLELVESRAVDEPGE